MMIMRLYYQVMFTRALCLTEIDVEIEIEILFCNDSSILMQSFGNSTPGLACLGLTDCLICFCFLLLCSFVFLPALSHVNSEKSNK